MNEDHVWEMYHSELYQPETVRACRDRIHWLAARARGRVVDVGCSQGVLPILLAREGHESVGVDLEQPAIDFALAKLAKEPAFVRDRVRFQTQDVFTWEPGERFDTVILGEVLEHVTKPEALIEIARRLVADGGQLLVTVPLGWLDHHDHKQAFLPTDLLGLLEGKFGVRELDIVHEKICVAASAGEPSVPEAIDPRRLLVAVERALLAIQYRAVDRERNEAAQRRKLTDRIAKLTDQVGQLTEQKKALASRASAVAERSAALEARSAERLAKLRGSGTFQLGALLVGVGKRPASALRLPDRLAALAYREIARRRSRGRSGPAPRKPLVRHVFEGSYRVTLPGARGIAAPADNRVLHVLECSLPHQQNGYTLRSAQIVRAQRAHGWDPTVVTRPGFPASGDLDQPEIVAGAPHFRLPGRTLSDKPNLVEYLHAYVTEAAEVVERVRPAIIHAGSNFRNAYAAMELARNYRLPFVYEVRGLWEETRVANGRLARHDQKYRQLVDVETHCMRAADAIVTLGESLKAELVRRGIAASKIFLVRNAVDAHLVEVRAPRDELRASLGLTGRFVVSYIGSVTPLESLEHLIEAISILRRDRADVSALIVGDGAATEDLKQLALARGVSDRVRFAGAVPFAEVADYYAISDAVACTRGRHRVCELVTPLKPYEAMAYHKPVIVSDIPALREMVVDGETGRIVPAEDPTALARVLAELADDPTRCAALGESSYAWVREHRSWERVTEAYRDAYQHARMAFAKRTQ